MNRLWSLRRVALCLALTCWPLASGAQSGDAADLPTLVQVQAQMQDQSDDRPAAPTVDLDPARSGADQQSAMGILVLDVDQAYVTSAWGKRAQTDIEAAAREIEAENTRMEDQLIGEEQALAVERDRTAPAEFRQKAEAFDIRAQTVRRERRQAAVDLGNRAQADRNAFVEATLPVIAAIMQEREAGLVLDRRQALAAVSAIDITQDLVERMDATIGDGGALPELPPPSDTPDDSGTALPAPAPPSQVQPQ